MCSIHPLEIQMERAVYITNFTVNNRTRQLGVMPWEAFMKELLPTSKHRLDLTNALTPGQRCIVQTAAARRQCDTSSSWQYVLCLYTNYSTRFPSSNSTASTQIVQSTHVMIYSPYLLYYSRAY